MAVMDINEILEILPHRFPFLLVDQIIECGQISTKNAKDVISFARQSPSQRHYYFFWWA